MEKEVKNNPQTGWEERFRQKFGRFYYSDIVGIDWEKPKEKNVTGEIPDGHNGYCIASDDIESFIQKTLDKREEEIIEKVLGFGEIQARPELVKKILNIIKNKKL